MWQNTEEMGFTCPHCKSEVFSGATVCLQCGFSFVTGPPKDSVEPGQVEELLLKGRKIEAIKKYREISGSGLKEAKEAVEKIGEKLVAEGRISPRKQGCIGLLILIFGASWILLELIV